MNGPALVWFRNDLRLRDHPAINDAARESDRPVIGLFLIADEQWREHDWGAPKIEFVLRNVAALSRELEAWNIPLLIRRAPRFADAPDAIEEVVDRFGIERVTFNRELEVNEQSRDDEVAGRLEDRRIEVARFEDQTVVVPEEPRTGSGGFYRVFTPYFRSWKARLEKEGAPTPTRAPRRRSEMPVQPDPLPTGIEGLEGSGVDPALWPGGEQEAGDRLDRFVDERSRRYHESRDFPELEATSRLSPYLACGALSARQALAAAIDANLGRLEGGDPGPATWITELAWREFYRHVLVGFPHVCRDRAFKRETDAIEWDENPEALERWAAGRTGVPIVDAAMRQLSETGWMHNRLRMIVAMYLTKNLFLDWRLGERHFMNRLVDGDFASNNGGWQWSASTGCDAAPYFRIFNPTRQSEKWDPEGRFIRRYCAELSELDGAALHDPGRLKPLERAALDYPEPMVDQATSRERVIHAFKRLGRSDSKRGRR